MFYKSNFSVELVIANQNCAIKTNTISENGWSSKSQMNWKTCLLLWIRTFLVLFLIIITFASCESTSVSDGRRAYKSYFKEVLKDPESLRIYKEEILEKGDVTCKFRIDYGAKNSYGAYVRKTTIIEAIGSKVVRVDGEYFLGSGNTYNKEPQSSQSEPKIDYPDKYGQYESITSPSPMTMVQLVDESIVGQTKIINKDIWAAKWKSDFEEADKAFRNKDKEKFNEKYYFDYLVDLKKGDKVKIVEITRTYCKIEIMSGEQKDKILYMYDRGFFN